MTIAVCVKCGFIKHGAFGACGACGAFPETETELAYALALTDHYFAAETLEEISTAMLDGKPHPLLPPEQEQQFRQMITGDAKLMRALEKMRGKLKGARGN
jgi:hypothetical protein